jgi:hypothetical protein
MHFFPNNLKYQQLKYYNHDLTNRAIPIGLTESNVGKFLQVNVIFSSQSAIIKRVEDDENLKLSIHSLILDVLLESK